jgi:hypothetical protein
MIRDDHSIAGRIRDDHNMSGKIRDDHNISGGGYCQSCIGSCLKYSAVRVIDTLDQRVQRGTHIGIAHPASCQ